MGHVLDLGSRKFWRVAGRVVDLEAGERWLRAPTSGSPRVTDAWLEAEAAWHGGALSAEDPSAGLLPSMSALDGPGFDSGRLRPQIRDRRWSTLAALPGLPARADEWSQDEPVVAVTLARMRLTQVPRFLRWGRPVERLVRDHPGTTLAHAAFRPPHTISTFSVWRSVREMEEMVRGRSVVPDADRHAAAMAERQRRDFHHEFATYRFRALSEHGTWQGRSGIVPVAGS